jgi:hypothetical protein
MTETFKFIAYGELKSTLQESYDFHKIAARLGG